MISSITTQKLKLFSMILVFVIGIIPVIAYTDVYIEQYDRLPFKYQRSNQTWSDFINTNYNPSEGSWQEIDDTYGAKCLSYAASTLNDWIALSYSGILQSSQNYMNNETINGTNPREMEAIYNERLTGVFFGDYNYIPIIRDSVTREKIFYDLKGYLDIINNPPTDWQNKNDPTLGSNYKHTVTSEEYTQGYEFIPININLQSIKTAIKKYGILYAHFRGDGSSIQISPDIFAYWFGEHAVAIVGYRDYGSSIDVWVHDSAYNNSESNFFLANINDIQELYALYDPQWSTFHHDNRRMGLTTLRGDMTTQSRVNQLNLVLDSNIGQDHISRASVTDVDNDGRQDVVIASSKMGSGVHDGDLFASELTWTWRGYQMRKKWYFNVTYEVEAPPSLGNIDSDKQREVVFGLDNGTLIAVDVNPSGSSAALILDDIDVDIKEENV